MELNRALDGYCERLDPGLWAEPVNALTNLAFLVAAVIMWRRCNGQGLGAALSAALFAIGLCSGLFHTHAVVWTAAADSLSILVFILLYLYAANRRFLAQGRFVSLVLMAGFVPYAAALGFVFAQIPGLGGSAFYAPVAVLILGYALWVRRRMPEVARNLSLGAGILIVSLTARTLDVPLCDRVEVGTHFLWHLLNGLLLGWMIETYRRAGVERLA